MNPVTAGEVTTGTTGGDPNLPWWAAIPLKINDQLITPQASASLNFRTAQFQAFNMMRSYRTMTSGGTVDALPGGMIRGLPARTKAFFRGRYASQEQLLDPDLSGHSGYQLANMGNWLFQGGEKGFRNPLSRVVGPERIFAKGHGIFTRLTGKFQAANVGDQQRVFSGGFLGQNLTALRMSQGNLSARQVAKYGNFMDKMSPNFASDYSSGLTRLATSDLEAEGYGMGGYIEGGYGSFVDGMPGGLSGGAADILAGADDLTASQLMGISSRGVVNQYMGGYMGSIRGFKQGVRGLTDEARAYSEARAERLGVTNMSARGAEAAASALERGGYSVGERVTLRSIPKAISTAYRGTATRVAEETATKAGASMAGEAAGTVAADAAVEATAEGGILAAAGTGAAAFASFLDPITWPLAAALTVKTVYDISKLAFTLGNQYIVKPAVKFAKDANRSFQGNLDKAPMTGFWGKGFIDNEVTATSRARGVMAIQNSRLNARSVLGSEAAALHAHFG